MGIPKFEINSLAHLTLACVQSETIVMTVTCQSVLIHVVKVILQADAKIPLNQCITENEFDSVSDLISSSEPEIAIRTYTVDSHYKHSEETKSRYSSVESVFACLSWYWMCWLDVQLSCITKAFNTFRFYVYDHDSPTACPHSGSNTLVRSPVYQQVDFQTQLHHNQSHFRLSSKEDLRGTNLIMRSIQRKTISTIYAHGCDSNEGDLFQEQNKFMFDVFLSILQPQQESTLFSLVKSHLMLM